MEFVKYNQLLKIRVEYDQDHGQIGFNDFIEDNGLEPVGEHAYAYFPNEPRWTESEINGMTEEERLVWKEWFEVAQEEELLPYRYAARGHSQGDVSHLYLIGMDEHEAERLAKEFEQYAYDCPYQYSVELIDCETGETITDESLCGIYDDTFDLRYLKCELKGTLNGMGEIHPELRDSALEAVAEIDYTDINQ